VRTKQRRSLRRAWQVLIWPLSGHVALALATGLACGTAVARYPDVIALAPPYAAILGTLVIYPVLVATWWHFSASGGRGR
jgi:hypothetical protein